MNKLWIKLVLVSVFLVVLSFALFSSVLLTTEWNKLADDIVKEGKLFADFTSGTIYDYYLNYYSDPSEGLFQKFSQLLQADLSRNPDVLEVALVGVNGRILFDSKEIETGKYSGPDRFVSDQEELALLKSDQTTVRNVSQNDVQVAEIFVPVKESSGSHVTSVRYIISYQSIRSRLDDMLRQILIAFVPTLFCAVIVAFLMALTITRPISELSRLAQEVSRGRQITSPIKVKSRDEIGQLA
ncbi:MAG TPA: HAMP domain-containing protein, partial [Candidatus Paceibacterota bacterium]|nr:HAMP domain-containing protein [Candidatus Paceibacterota bacterium]